MASHPKPTRTLPLLILALTLAGLGTFHPPRQPVATASGLYTLFLPVVVQPGALAPAADTTLPGGTHHFTQIDIPAGVAVTVAGPAVFEVSGNIRIAGALVADCHALDLQAAGDVSITGKVDNTCSTASAAPGDLTIHTAGGSLAIGTLDTPAQMQTSGQLDIANAPDLAEWEFDVLPHQRSAQALPPVCSARAEPLFATVLPDAPAEVAFTGSGADPDGGPVTYAWDFGDGGSGAGAAPEHAYAGWGAYDVGLTVTDDEAQTCQAALRVVIDDGESSVPAAPAAWAEPLDLVAAVGQGLPFLAEAFDFESDVLTYAWSFGDGGISLEPSPVHTYTAAGRYEMSLTVADSDGNASLASAAVYVYAEPLAGRGAAAGLAAAVAGDCVVPGPNVFNTVYDGGQAAAGQDGRRAIFRGRGDVYLGIGTDIHAQDGGDGVDRSGSGTVVGGRGGRGGSLQILVAGNLHVCGGTSLAAGDGGEGGSAFSDTPAPGTALARGGNGGNAAPLLRIAATGSLSFESPFGLPIVLLPGSGGDGGAADALGGEGAAQCPTGRPGATAIANGGRGGRASKLATVSGAVSGLANVQVRGAQGGDGANASAIAGDGADVTCATTANGGLGKPATARGGQGGDAKLSGAGGFVLALDAFTAGDGGDADSLSGWGGDATATPPGGTVATGGAAGLAAAYGGRGGDGRIAGDGGDADARGGWGGDATATGQPGLPCGPGGSATANGGAGGNAHASFGRGGNPGGTNGEATATARHGGDATATGGRGGDCADCPAGAGGDGGPATARGGRGGSATGNDERTGGDGGDADATGGMGGNGANCCDDLPGGNGGKGGDATSTAGQPGTPPGTVGGNATKGGDGGAGGDGTTPGVGGAFGLGTGTPVDIPDGVKGPDGDPCPISSTTYSPDWTTIPDGVITPGSQYSLTTFSGLTPTGVLNLRFMTQAEFSGTVGYQKSGAALIVQSGGLVFDLAPLVPALHVEVVELRLVSNCPTPGCVTLVGYYQGEVISQTPSQPVTGEQVLVLPAPPLGIPYYDQVVVLAQGPAVIQNQQLLLRGQAQHR